MSRKTPHALAVLSIAAFPIHALAQWQGSDFFRPPPSVQEAARDKSSRAAGAVELIDKQQGQNQEAGSSLAGLQQQFTELKDKVAQQETLLRVVLERFQAETLKAR